MLEANIDTLRAADMQMRVLEVSFYRLKVLQVGQIPSSAIESNTARMLRADQLSTEEFGRISFCRTDVVQCEGISNPA